jgi:hypothetical protein
MSWPFDVANGNAGQAISTVPSPLGTGRRVLRAPDPAPFPLRTHPGLQLRARLPFGAIITALNVCGRQLQGQVSRAVSDLAKAVAKLRFGRLQPKYERLKPTGRADQPP